MNPAGEWCLIESDPGVFTALIRDFGVRGVQVEELCSLDESSFANIQPVHGLIFLFKYINDSVEEGAVVEDSRLEKIFFAKQVISNACATQAIISVLMNCDQKTVTLGATLQDLKDFTHSFDANMKGLTLSNSKTIRQVHNSFSRQQVFEYDEKAAKEEDSYHFIAYMPIDGRLYELDGLKSGPIDHGAIKSDDWLESVRPVIQKRIGRYASSEINFNLMAVVGDQKDLLENKLAQLTQVLDTCKQGAMAADQSEMSRQVTAIEREMAETSARLASEAEKRRAHHVENVRRKHNYLPFIVEMIRVLAAEGKLMALIDDVKAREGEKRAEGKKTPLAQS